ncbi:MAG: amino acid adenylation domain-containing protein [Chlorobiaceae bacterium]|nr:amino acid adenylation domain-containing protein [Chlorobiaceae bacterium]
MHYSHNIDEYFRDLALKQPDSPALISDNGLVTYAELDAAAERVAMELLSRGIESQEAVGVLTERSAGLPAAFLGILKAGAVYVPMVAELPPARLGNIAEQASIRQLIVLDGIEPPQALLNAVQSNCSAVQSDVVIRPEELSKEWQGITHRSEINSHATDLAAILFTSGSTGTPKGVMIKHDACVNMARGHIAAHKISGKDRILLATSPGFILGFRELCLPLISGAAYVPVSRSIIDNPEHLLEYMGRHLVSIAMFTPSYLHLLKRTVPNGLRCIITAGERPNIDDAKYYAQFVDYWNVHGATEVCGAICMHRVDPEEEGLIPSGRPFANNAVHLLDNFGNEVPKGEVGELYVTGIGISPGYLKQPQLSAEFFVETPFGRAFRSHDLARWNKNSELEALGRADNVVKISGQSVSLGEIELALRQNPIVRQAAALFLQGRLVACVECADTNQAEEIDWREFLRKTLPSYMIPAQVALLQKIPINSAGKVDQKALLDIADSLYRKEFELAGGMPPQGEVEILIAGIWEELLDVRPIMRESNFFAVGGTSLMAIAVSQRLRMTGYKVTVQMVLSSLTVESLAAHIVMLQDQSSGINDDTPAENIATSDQEDFWIASEIGISAAASHIVRILRVHGRVPQPGVWQTAWSHMIERHAALRSAFYMDEKRELRWRTTPFNELHGHASLLQDQCSSIEVAREIVKHWANERFLLTTPPLVRAGLITLEHDNETLFWFVIHHSVVDGTSARLIQEDLLDLLADRPIPAAQNGIAMASHAEQRYFASDRFAGDREFWGNKLESLIRRGTRAFDEYVRESHRQRASLPSGRGAKPLAEQLDAVTVKRLGRLAKKNGAGMHALLLSLLAVEIRRRSGEGDIMVGSGISIRPAGGENAIGHFVNVLPVILMQKGNIPLSTLIQSTQSSLTEAVEHGTYPAALLYREFRHKYPDLRSRSRASLFDIALTAIPPRICIDNVAGITLEPLTLAGELEHPAAGLDLSFSHEPCPESGGGVNLLLTWNPDVCSRKSAEGWLSSFAAWARWLAEKPERIEEPIPALLPQEKALLEQWEQGEEIARPKRRCFEIFQAVAEKHPERPAIVSRERNKTFKEIDERSNGIAHRLIEEGVERGSRVAVLASGPTDILATVLGIWKAGATYLPLPGEYPATRLSIMVKDAGAEFLVVLDGLAIPQLLCDSVAPVIRPEECKASSKRPHIDGSPDDIAYIIYTSGTTGKPKGVPVTHRAYINAVLGVAERVGLQPEDRMSLVSSIGFDASLWELGHGLLNGIALVPVSPALREDPWLLKRYYREAGVTVAFHAPSYLRVSEELPFEGLRILLTGGEAPNHNDVRHHADRSEFWNFYGPTEATIVVAGGRVMSDHHPEIPITVGRPLPNLRISIKRSNGSQVPPGVEGELWLGGMGISHGYVNRHELNAGCFVSTPDGLFYRSGDYGRWTADGQIEISGRIDHQIKLNGQRVELGEIEQTLCKHPAILNASVVAEELDSGVKVLLAFIQPKINESPAEASIKAFLAERLSVHMIPASIISLTTFPLTLAGKVDRDALLALAKQQDNRVDREIPQGPLEQHIAAIWSDVLGQPVTRHDNFFALGGNSLLAVTLAHRITESLGRKVSARALFAAPVFSAFVEQIESLPALEEQEILTITDLASEGEKEFWTAESAGLDTRTFTIPVCYLVNGEITQDRLQNAWSTLVARHEGLRTFFEDDGSGQLKRRVAKEIDDTLEFAAVESSAAALAHIRQGQLNALPMHVAPLWRAGLVEACDEHKRYFWLALHHAVGDGQSTGTLFDELTIVLASGDLPVPCKSGTVFAYREQAYFASLHANNDLKYWKSALQEIPVTAFEEWPLDMPRSSTNPPGCHRLELLLDSQTTEGLKTLARTHKTTLHALILSLLALEVRRRTRRTDVVIGTTASLRESASDANIVGYGVNMLPLHLKTGAGQCFGDLLQATQHTLAEALQHARLPFSHIYRAYWNDHPEIRNPQRYPLFDIAVTENPGTRRNSASCRFTRAINATKSPQYVHTDISPGQDMVLIHENQEGGELILQWHVNAALYSEESARIWLDALSGWARWLAADPLRSAQPLPQLLPEEETLLFDWGDGETVERPHLRFHELFERVVDRPGQADRPAVITRNSSLSYRYLEEEANLIAHALLYQGVKREIVVGVLTGRSPHLPAAVLGIWKAGGTYLPLASELPQERLIFMVQDAAVSHLIVLDALAVPEQLADKLPNALRPEELSEPFRQQHSTRVITAGSPDDTAYIIYTSGSSGKPKGTLISHRSFVNMTLGAAEISGLTHVDRCLMFASPSFDVSLSDFGVPFACGAAICHVTNEIIESPNRLLDFVREASITLADITPTYLALFEGTQLPPSLRTLITGGEAPVYGDVQRYASKLHYFNAYGPTENTITSTMALLDADNHDFISAGKPLPNTSLHICDRHGELLPPGVTGEILLGGMGISQEYLNQPELTHSSFITTPSGYRYYKSGDLGRWHRNGIVEIIGRIDSQVKMNGIRIEPGEIEHALSTHPALSQAVVLLHAKHEGAKSLWAFVRLKTGAQMPDIADWQKHLRERVPSSMIPSGVIPVESIPLTVSGKVDRSALLALLEKHSLPSGLTPPQNELECCIAEIWATILGKSPIHREDNFFALGGHSLRAIAVAHQLEKALECEIPARELFAEPTLAGFAERVRMAQPTEAGITLTTDLCTLGQREFWTAEQAGVDTSGFNLSLKLIVQGNTTLSVNPWQAIWNKLIKRHDALRTSFHEDESGILRRFISKKLDKSLEFQFVTSYDEAHQIISSRQSAPLVMSTPGLWRAGLMEVEGCLPIFWLVMHHAVSDGLSLGILINELSALIKGKILPPLAIGFDYSAAREVAYLKGREALRDATYWKGVIAELLIRAPEALGEWPLDKPRAKTRSATSCPGSHCFRTRLDRSTVDALRTIAQRNKATLHALMLTLLGVEVRRRTGRSGFLLGTAASNRQSAAEAQTIGYFINMLPLACHGAESHSFERSVETMQQNLAEALQHSRYPFARIYGDFRQEHTHATNPGRYPLFDIAATENPAVEITSESDLIFTGIALPESGEISYELRRNGPAQDLVLVHEGVPDGGLIVTWYANAAIYTEDTANGWFDSLVGWMRFLGGKVYHNEIELPRLLPEEKQLLDRWQQGPLLSWSATSFPELFRRIAKTHSEHPAIVTDAGMQSYKTVNFRTDALANALLKLGVKRGETVGVFTERSASLPETVLAIWKAAACYLPLTADLPAERLAFMARDAELRIIIVLDTLPLPPELSGGNFITLRPENILCGTVETPEINLTSRPDDRAYILYTSGSTGLPKGVVLLHEGLLNLALGEAEIFGMTCEDRLLQLSSPSFDLWISDLVITWSTGAALVPIRREEMNDISGMHSLLKRLGVTIATMSPSYLRLFEHSDFPGLRIMMTVGEQPIPEDALFYATRLEYFNGYGPTENTAASALGRIHPDTEQITVGRPLSNIAIYIVDECGNILPPGVIGELWLAGAGLAAGYLNRPDLTAASFVDFAGERCYRTGDLGRWLRSGELQILGRRDTQVKLRGQRVELGEIEHRLMSCPGVKQAVAIVEALPDHTQVLRSFVTMDSQTATPTQTEWASYLSEALPSYMIPASVVRIAALPLNAAGKVDRQLLLNGVETSNGSATSGTTPNNGYSQQTAPQNTAEKRVAELWQQQLHQKMVAREHNFFEIGGDSLKAIAVISQLRREYQCHVNNLYEHPVLSDFALCCRPRPDHLRSIIGALSAKYAHDLELQAAIESEREEALRPQRILYKARICSDLEHELVSRNSYRHVLLTGATGYLGSYLLRELLADQTINVTALVRSTDNQSAHARVGKVLACYFGGETGSQLRDNPRLKVVAGDLRHPELLLSHHDYDQLSDSVDAIYHCAANVNHIGLFHDFLADNVDATRHLVTLAARRKPTPSDLHFVSTMSVFGNSASDSFRLYTEYDFAPETPDDNYYIRTKQEAERLVIASRGELANACIHRVGNIAFATDSTRLQQNIRDNAFFRQLVAFLRLGVIPAELNASLSHVDVVARSLMALADTKTLTNEIHHIESSRQDRLADIILVVEGMEKIVHSCDIGEFLQRLQLAIDEPEMESALAETVENYSLQSDSPLLGKTDKVVVASDRTQLLLEKLGITWPAIPVEGVQALMNEVKKGITANEQGPLKGL